MLTKQDIRNSFVGLYFDYNEQPFDKHVVNGKVGIRCYRDLTIVYLLGNEDGLVMHFTGDRKVRSVNSLQYVNEILSARFN